MDNYEITSEVYKAKSSIISSSNYLKPGYGLFAKQNIAMGEVVCGYSGELIDCADARYVDPTYLFSWQLGKGYKLLGDDKDGDLGHYCNSTHPENPYLYKNACIDKRHLMKTKTAKYFYHLKHKRVRLHIIATRNIEFGEEIIINYGIGYWRTMEKFLKNGIACKLDAVVHREERAVKRAKRN